MLDRMINESGTAKQKNYKRLKAKQVTKLHDGRGL